MVIIILMMHMVTTSIQRSSFLIGICSIYTFLWIIINTVRRSIRSISSGNRDVEEHVEEEETGGYIHTIGDEVPPHSVV